MKYIALLISSFLLFSCATNVEQQFNQSVKTAKKTLKQAVQNNNENEKQFQQIPEYVKSALQTYDVFKTENGVFDIQAQEVPIDIFTRNLAKATELNFSLNPNLKDKNILISLNLHQVSLMEIAEALRQNYAVEIEKKKSIYYFSAPKRTLRFYKLNFLNLTRTGKGQMNVDSSQALSNLSRADNNGLGGGFGNGLFGGSRFGLGYNRGYASQDYGQIPYNYLYPSVLNGGINASASQLNSAFTTDNVQFWKNIKNSILSIIDEAVSNQQNSTGENKYVTMNPFTGVISVKAFPNQLEEVSRYLAMIQENVQRQVIIQAKIIEVTLENGLDTALTLDSAGFKFDSDTNTFRYNTSIKKPDFSMILQALSSYGQVSVLSDPVVSTLNNQKAVIKVGVDRFFSTGLSNAIVPTNATSSSVVSNYDLEPFFSGISLDVTPQISDDGHVLMNIHPLINRVTQRDVKFTNTNTDAESSSVSIPTAESVAREADTMVRVRDGEIILIGGLMQNLTSNQRGGLPGLGFDAAYDRKETGTKTDLIILLKPIIVKKGSWNDAINVFSENLEANNPLGGR
jgi:MSHA biogenesis protein MshL